MKLPDFDPEVQDSLIEAFQNALNANLKLWDETRWIETILGIECDDLRDYIDGACAGIIKSEITLSEALKIAEEYLTQLPEKEDLNA